MQFAARLRQERLRRHLSQEALAEALGVSPRSIVRWEQGRVVPQPSVRLHLTRFFGLRSQELFADGEMQTPLPVLWTVPFPRNPCFTGREAILSAVHERLALSEAIALCGLGGIGKTQLAIEYAYRYALEYHALFWLAAETTESLLESFVQIAEQLQLPERHAPEQTHMVRAVQHWLNTHQGWLLIADNVEELGLLQAVLPATRQGALLLTTRHQTLGLLAEPLEVPPMDEDEGIALVLRRARQTSLPLQEEQALSSQRLSPDTLAAAELVKLLDKLPLALDQAGAYIDETGCSIAEYVQRYQQQRKQVLARRGIHGGAHPASVSTTLEMAIGRITQENQAAADLLRLCAFLHAEAIPEELFVTGAYHLGAILEPIVTDPYQFDLILATLRSASLVTRQSGMRTFSVHRLVQAVLLDHMELSEAHVWRERVICMVNAAFPEGDFASWAQCEQYLAHALACVPPIEMAGCALPAAAELLYKEGNYLVERGRYKEAEALLDQALALGENQYGSDHPILIPRLEKRAELFWRQEEYGSTELLLHRVLALEERHLGLTHPRTAETLNNLATLYQKQGKYEQAESLYQRSLHIEEQQLGPGHPEIATTLNNLAVLYRKQGKYAQAESLYQRSLHIREQQLGCDHPETAFTLSNLARLYGEQRKYEIAEPLYQRALHIREQQLGSEHPDTAHTLNNLATLYREQGKYEQAEFLYQRVLHIWEHLFDSEHPERATTLANLATLYWEQGKHDQAEQLYQQALALGERRLEREHPHMVKIRNEYASFLEQSRNVRDLAIEDFT